MSEITSIQIGQKKYRFLMLDSHLDIQQIFS